MVFLLFVYCFVIVLLLFVYYSRCEGSIMDVVKLPSVKSEGELSQLLSQYETFKHPDTANIQYPDSMKGRCESELSVTSM